MNQKNAKEYKKEKAIKIHFMAEVKTTICGNNNVITKA